MEKEVQKLKMVCKTDSEYNGEWLIYDILSEMNDMLGYNADGNDAIEYIFSHMFDDEIDDEILNAFCRPDMHEMTIEYNGNLVKISKIY